MSKIHDSGKSIETSLKTKKILGNEDHPQDCYRLLVESISDYAICMLDPAGIILTWNPGARNLTGFSSLEVIGKHYSIFSTEIIDVRAGKSRGELVQAKLHGRFEYEAWLGRNDGSKFWANIVITPVFNEDQDLIGFAQITRDLSDRKNVETNLRSIYESLDHKIVEEVEKRRKVDLAFIESERQFRTLADAIPQMAWMAEADGFIFWYNKRWFDYTGISPDIKEDWGWQKVVDPQDFPRLMQNWNESISSGKPFEMEFALKDANGNYRWFLTRGTPVYDSNGNIARWFGTSTDIQNQKEIEKRLEDALNLRDEFLSIASHELKTPITSLKLQIDMARRGIGFGERFHEVPQLKKTFEISLKQVNRLIDLIENLLDVSRIQSGSFSCTFEDLNLKEVVEEVLERFSEQLATAKIVPSYEIPSDIFGSWDRLRLEQVFANLISNAIKYAPGWPLKIVAKKSDSNINIQFQDKGPGIPTSLHSKLFDRFERVGASTRIGGLGLGLYITKQIVNAHSGDIRVESKEGKGSNFIINIPLKSPTQMRKRIQLEEVSETNMLH